MLAVKGFNEISYDELMDVNGGELEISHVLEAAGIIAAMSGHQVAAGICGLVAIASEVLEPRPMPPSTCPYPYYSPGPYWWSTSCY